MPIPPGWQQQLADFVSKLKSLDWFERLQVLGDNPLNKFAITESVKSWADFSLWLEELKGCWCFRGQRESSWSLETSLDRAVRVEHATGHFHRNRESDQHELLFRFQQQAHYYIHTLPEKEDIVSWLALMQHFGVPTRLLDWTKSPYAALHFALVDEPQNPNEESSAVWSIDLTWLNRMETDVLGAETSTSIMQNPKDRAEYLNSLLAGKQERKALIVKVEPQRISERMAAQQGIFLCKLIHEVYFDHVLVDMMINSNRLDQPIIRKLTIEKNLRIEILKHLREMNIHSASLFPGLDGFGKYLKLDLEIEAKSELLQDVTLPK